jgi:hypothetical protein
MEPSDDNLNQVVNKMLGDSIKPVSLAGRLLLKVACITLCLVASHDAVGAEPARSNNVKHVKVYAEPGRFGGWPANHGIWSWGDEILVGFSAGYFKDNGPDRHAIDHSRPEEHLLARSLDGGQSWSIENPAERGR